MELVGQSPACVTEVKATAVRTFRGLFLVGLLLCSVSYPTSLTFTLLICKMGIILKPQGYQKNGETMCVKE